LAGIFGPGREPLRWLEKGLIKNGLKRVNLIHVSDIVDIIFAFASSPLPRQRINVCNGTAPTWNELAAVFQDRGALPKDFSLPQSPVGLESKIVTNERLASLLPGKVWRTP
jgi:nucleoside-diphosphate-sugar epimerase